VTELQITACVFGPTYAFHLIAEGLAMFPFCGNFLYNLPFWSYKTLNSPALFSMTLRTRLSDAFHHLVTNDNVHCQTPLKNAKFDLFGNEECLLANLVANRDWLIVTVLQATACTFRKQSKQLQRHDSIHLSSIYTDENFSSAVMSKAIIIQYDNWTSCRQIR